MAGDFLLPHNGEPILVKGAVGYDFLVVAGDRAFVEYKPARGGWVADHLEKPNDATWFERGAAPTARRVCIALATTISPAIASRRPFTPTC